MLFLIAILTFTLDNENQWSDRIASSFGDSEREVRMPDGTRADIIDYKNKVTYEVDWDKKFYEGVGQSLYYSMVYSSFRKENFRPGVILLMKDETELKHVYRATRLCVRLKIKVVIVDTINNIVYTEEGRYEIR